MSLDFELYEGKKYSDLVKDIVKNHKNKQTQIKVLTEQLVDMVSEPGDAVMIVPLIKGYLDSDIKNDEALVKLAQIVQKANQVEGDKDNLLNIESLFSEIQGTRVPTIQELKELPNTK